MTDDARARLLALVEELREGVTVLDEPFHIEALAQTMLEAADELEARAARLVDEWICEEHPERPWPHDDCAGPGMPVSGQIRALVYQRDAALRQCAPTVRREAIDGQKEEETEGRDVRASADVRALLTAPERARLLELVETWRERGSTGNQCADDLARVLAALLSPVGQQDDDEGISLGETDD